MLWCQQIQNTKHMEALLFVSGALLAYQYKKHPQLAPLPLFMGVQEGEDTLLEGASVMCNDGTQAVYRYMNGMLRLYPTAEIALSWNNAWDKDIVTLSAEACAKIPKGVPLNMASEEERRQNVQTANTNINMRKGQLVVEDEGTFKDHADAIRGNYYPNDYFYNVPPRNVGPPPVPLPFPSTSAKVPFRPGITNPVELDMMQDIRQQQPKLAATYRPSWVRNFQDDVQRPRQEGVEAWSSEIPRVPDGNYANLNDMYQRVTKHTLNEFGKGGLPFATQDRVIPDGLDPVASNRPMTKRYNTYALGDDLTSCMADQGRVRGLNRNAIQNGNVFREEGWEVMPNRGIVMKDTPAPLGASATGIRSGGRGGGGVPLGSAMQMDVEPLPNMMKRGEIEWDHGRTGNKGLTEAGAVRPMDDPLDKRFVYEELDMERPQTGVSHVSTIRTRDRAFRDTNYDATPHNADIDTMTPTTNANPRTDIKKGNTGKAAEKTSWKFSFDMKQLFDMSQFTTAKNREHKFSNADDLRGEVLDLDANRQIQRIHVPMDKSMNRKNYTIDFKTESTNAEKGIATSAIRTTKKLSTEDASAVKGVTLGGRNSYIKKSSLASKLASESNELTYNNDAISDRIGNLLKPLRAPKSSVPDYAQETVNGARNKGEFRRR